MQVVLIFPDDRDAYESRTESEQVPRIGELVFIEGEESFRVADVQHQYRETDHGPIQLMILVILADDNEGEQSDE